MRYEHKRVVDLTDEELARCRGLSFGDEGYMNEDLNKIIPFEQKRRYRYSWAILARDDNGIAGWALVQPYPYTRWYTAQLFVDPAFRRQGIGGRLLAESNKYVKRPYVYVDDENEEFFMRYPELSQEY